MSTETQPLFNPNDGLTGRDGGPYLDEVEMELAEEQRAVVEDREPDYENPLATAGVPLQTAGKQVAAGFTGALPSQQHNDVIGTLLADNAESEIGAPKRGEAPTAEAVKEAQEKAVKAREVEEKKSAKKTAVKK